MNRTLCTFPGRAGDLLWSLPVIRAIAESLGHPVDLQIAGEFEGMLELLRLQPYLDWVGANPHWGMEGTWLAPPVVGLETPYDQVIHLGYRRWPELALPREVEQIALDQWQDATWGPLQLIDLARPWITVAEPVRDIVLAPLAAGWTDCWFELKLGIVECLKRADIDGLETAALLTPPGSRWEAEAGFEGSTWLEAAWIIQNAKIFLGDCSALHVLAVALGKPCVLVEPMEARWNPIFWPLGMDGRVRCVKGLDGQPTFDARHVADTLREVLGGQ